MKNKVDLYRVRTWVYEWECPNCHNLYTTIEDPRQSGLIVCDGCAVVSEVGELNERDYAKGMEPLPKTGLDFYIDIKRTLEGYTWTVINGGKSSITRFVNVCINNKISSIKSLEQMTRDEFRNLKFVGFYVLHVCEEYLKRKGTSFKKW
jgi:hypothetical protein